MKVKSARRSSATSPSCAGLLEFIRYLWHTLEPKPRKLIEGWPLEIICLHLEAVTFGDIASVHLLMNVPQAS
jgi:hypothetical protein